ncbi:MAG: hypothetical protein KAS32_21555, partial [Candidatus Peribacteraceae bacterium]|nr:hypothetical protein [Candidatus Peribacteraceae bacterium]
DDVITVRLHVENASNIGNYQSYYYKIDGVQSTEGSIICTIDTENSDDNTYYYDCTIPVVNFPVCNGPGTSTISVNFNYLGGVKLSGSFPITLVPATPKLIVNSLLPAPFDCGIDSEVTIQLQVNDPISQAPETYYTFDNTNFNDLDCTSSGHTYSCTIDGDEVCSLLQEHLEVTVKFTYGEIETLAQPAPVFVTFPPPSMGIDTVTPQTVEAGETTDVSVLLHVNYPDTITFQEDDFNYKYLSNSFSAATCTLESSYSNIKYYKCTVPLVIPSTSDGVNDLSFRLDGFMEGAPKQLTAKTFFEIMPPPPEPAFTITSTSSPVDCVTDSSAEVRIKAENIDLLSVSDFKYTIDGTTYIDNECTKSSNILTCTITAAELCDTMKNLVIIKYSIDDTYYTNSQKIYLQIPDPHMQVYAVQPDTLSSGEVNSVNIKLFVQHPEMVGTSPSFLYNYASKSDQPLTCVKVSSTANRDFYECANTQFDLTSYSASSLSVLFSIQGSLVTFPMVIPVADVADTNPWLEIVSTTPSRIETELGNQTSASLYVTVHNAMAADLKHQATVIPNSILSAGTCTEADVEYDFNCDVTIRMPANADPGANSVTLSLRMSNGKNYDFSNTTNVYAISDDTQLEIQSISPDNLYCGGQTQQNQNTVRVTARSKILTDFEIIEEVISFNGRTIPGSSRYCTAKGQAITCNIPTDKLMAAVTCDSGDLAPGEGSHFYTFDLTLLVKAGGNSEMLSGFGDISVTARPLEPYLEILDNDVVSGALQSPINCLIGQSIKLGDSGYVRIMYADLLHPEPKEDDL